MTTKADEFFININSVAGAPTERKSPGASQQGSSSAPKAEFYKDPSVVEENTEVAADEKKVEAPTVLTAQQIEDAGKTGAYLAGSALETAFGLAERIVYINRFSRAEKQAFIDLDAKKEKGEALTPEEDSLERRFLAVTAKHEKIKSKISLDKKEMESLEKAYAEKARITQKALDPQLIVWTTISKIFISRSMDIFL